MTGEMIQLLTAAALFVGVHMMVSSTPLRGVLLKALGERVYLALYSIAMIGLLAWLVLAYGAAPEVVLWQAGTGWRHLTYGVMVLSCILLVGGLVAPNPFLAGRPLEGTPQVRGVLAITRHPVLWAIGSWALVHIPANGDSRSVIFFGALALLALIGTRLIDRRKRAQNPAFWDALAAGTSNLPFLAMLQGRARPRGREIWGLPVLGGLALYALLTAIHPFVAGVEVPSPFG